MFLCATTKTGRSPRVRGSHLASIVSSCSSGSIPACAGEPSSPAMALCYARVDPRVCGGALLRRCLGGLG